MLRRAVATLCAGLMATTPALACTDVRLIAGDGSAMTVRTMEFAMELDSEVQIIPRGLQVTSPAPNGNGLKWTSKYGYVAMNAYDMPVATDGLNEKGLGFGALYLPGETKYQDIKPGEESRALSNAAFGGWVLGNFATVDEVQGRGRRHRRVGRDGAAARLVLAAALRRARQPTAKASSSSTSTARCTSTTTQSACSPTRRPTSGTSRTCATT